MGVYGIDEAFGVQASQAKQAWGQQMGGIGMAAAQSTSNLAALMQQQNMRRLTDSNNKESEKKGIMKVFKQYLEEHKDVIFTLLLALLIDHFVFGDAFKEKIRNSLNKLLDKAHDKIGS